jgi:hypothetical protein
MCRFATAIWRNTQQFEHYNPICVNTEPSKLPLEYRSAVSTSRLSLRDILISIGSGAAGGVLLLLAILDLLWGCFVLLGGPDPNPSQRDSYVGIFVGCCFLGFLIWVGAVLCLSAAFSRAGRYRPNPRRASDYLLPTGQTSFGLLLAVCFLLGALASLAGGGVWGASSAAAIGVVMLCLGLAGVFLLITGVIRLARVREDSKQSPPLPSYYKD